MKYNFANKYKKMGNEANCCQRCEDVKQQGTKTVILKQPAVKEHVPMPYTKKIPLVWDFEKDEGKQITVIDEKNDSFQNHQSQGGSVKADEDSAQLKDKSKNIIKTNIVSPVQPKIIDLMINQNIPIQNSQINTLPYSCIGLLYIHFPDDGQLYMGTAFQIGSKQVVTCAHHCFHRSHLKQASRMIYYPSVIGKIDLSSGIEVSKFNYPEKYRDGEYWQRGAHEYAHLTLSTPNICSQGYFKISFQVTEYLSKKDQNTMVEQDDELDNSKPIKILGYSSQYIHNCPKITLNTKELNNLQAQNQNLKSKQKNSNEDVELQFSLCEAKGFGWLSKETIQIPYKKPIGEGDANIKGQIVERLVYNIAPSVGMEGSPIFYESKGSFNVIGIHQGKAFNKYPACGSSCLFTAEVKNKVGEWKKQMKEDGNMSQSKNKAFGMKQKQLNDARRTIQEIKKRRQSAKNQSNNIDVNKDIEAYRRSLDTFQKINGKNTYQYASALIEMANLLVEQKNNQQAANNFEEGGRILEMVVGKKSQQYATCLNTLGTTYYKLGKKELGLEKCEQSLKIKEQLIGKKHVDYASNLHNIALILDGLGRIEQSLKYHKESLGARRQIYGNKSMQVANTLSFIGSLYKKVNKDEECIQAYTQCLQVREQVNGKQENIEVAKILFIISPLLYEAGRYDQCLESITKCTQMKLKILGEMNVDYQNTAKLKGKMQQKVAKKKEKREKSQRKSGRPKSSRSKKKEKNEKEDKNEMEEKK